MSFDSGDDEGLHPVERWNKLTDAIREATSKAFASSPSFDPDQPSVFQTYWRGVIADLMASVAEDDSIPEFISDPPIKRLGIAFWDEPDPMCCPCGIVGKGHQALVEKEAGIRKGDVLGAFMEFMYGSAEEVPDIWVQEEPDWSSSDEEDESETEVQQKKKIGEEQRTKQGVLMYQSDWMMDPGERNGENLIYRSPDPIIFIYCCPVDEYVEKLEREKQKESTDGNADADGQEEQQETQARL